MIAFLQAKADGLWTRSQIRPNIIAGLIVGVVALPLAMAFAIASGARPEQGIYTAIIASVLTSLFGGTRLQISGPTGAFVAVLSIITAQHGVAGLQVATLLAGIILIAFGMTRLGAVIRFIPHPVVAGFTAGIGVIIFVGQWKDFLGLMPAPAGLHFHEKVMALLRAMPTLSIRTALLGGMSLLILVLAPRFLKRIPAPLIALVVVTIIQSLCHFSGVATIGTAFGGIPRTLPVPSLPVVSGAQFISLIGPAFTIALLGAIESLLSAVVADGMADTRHDPNQELIGQGIANFVAPLFGGFAATGAIARTATNIRSGATSPLAALVHSGVLVLVILLLAPIASAIPLCCLSAILFVVAWNMSDVPGALRLIRGAPKPDVAVLLLTFFLTVFVDLVVAVNVGVIVAALLFMRRMAEAVQVEQEFLDSDARGTDLAAVAVFRIEGPLFFAAAAMLEKTLGPLRGRGRTIILRMAQVPFVDASGIAALEAVMSDFLRLGSQVFIVELRPNVRLKLERSGFMKARMHSVFDSLDQAMQADAMRTSREYTAA